MQTIGLLATAAIAANGQQNYQWSQVGGGRTRGGVWPPHALNNNVDYPAPATAAPRTKVLGRVTVVNQVGSPYPISQVTPLQYLEKLDFESILSKTPGCVVMSGNNQNVVAAMLGNGRLVGLPDPDQATATTYWGPTGVASKANLVFESSGAVDDGSDSIGIDAVLDASDNVYGVTLSRNNITNNARMYGFTVSTSGDTTSVSQVMWGGSQLALGLKSNIRALQLYHTSILMTSSKDSLGQTSGSAIVVPLASLTSGKGAAFVSTSPSTCSVDPFCSSNCCVTAVSLDNDNQGTITGNAYVDNNGVVALLAHSYSAKGTAVGSYSLTGTTNWGSSVQFAAETFQPDPVVDPWTNRVYWVGLGGKVQQGDSPIAIYCVDGTTGYVCPGYGDTSGGQGGGNNLDLSSIFDSPSYTSADFFYTGAIVPNAGNTGVDRIVYTVLTTDSRTGDNTLKLKPVGCVISIKPATGALLDSFCVKRDMNNAFLETLYLASAPLVCLNARGPGKHTMAVAQFDGAIFAFDPMSLYTGPLYVADPLTGANDRMTIATDFLAMTQGGTLVFTGWDDQAGDSTVVGIPGFLAIPFTPFVPSPFPSPSSNPPTPPSGNANTPAPSNAGKDAGIAIGVILGFAALAGVGVWYVGGIAPALALFTSPPSYSKMGGLGGGFGNAYSAVSSANIKAEGGFQASSGAAASKPFAGSGGYNSASNL